MRRSRKATLRMPKEGMGPPVHQMLGKSGPPRLSHEEYLEKVITLKDMEGDVIAKDVTRREALWIIQEREEERLAQSY